MTSSTGSSPFGSYYHDDRTQLIFTSSELTSAGMTAGNISSVSFNVTTASSQVLNNFKVKMRHAGTQSAFTAFADMGGGTLVYSDTKTITTGWYQVNFSTVFSWDGSSSVIVEVSFDNTSYTSNSSVQYTATVGSTVWSVYSDSGKGPAEFMTDGSGDTSRANVRFGWEGSIISIPAAITGNAEPSAEQNYIQTIVPQTNTGNAGAMTETIQYFDGLGRPMQHVAFQASPDRHDIVTPVGYDNFGREDTKYLPYALTTINNGAFVTNDKLESRWTNNYGTAEDGFAFAKTIFEPSPLNRVSKQGAPGSVWQPNIDPEVNDHSVKLGYGTNSVDDNVRMWIVNTVGPPTSIASYLANTLYKTTTWDENNNQTSVTANRIEEFKDKQGKVVLKRSYNGSEILSTYYVYDDFDLLRVVIPPLANGDAGSITTSVLGELCYQYKYDARKRMIEKKLPGVGWTSLVYDKRDRLVATQDEVMKSSGRWLVTKYDFMNRPVMTASKALADTRDVLQTYFDAYPAASPYFESRTATGIGYTLGDSFSGKLALAEPDLLSVTYYDTYGYPGAKTFNTAVKVSDYYNSATGNYYFDRAKGQVTGTRVKVLNGTEHNASGYRWVVSTIYYDDRYRPIQTLRDLYSTNATDNEVVSVLYDFTGKVMKTLTKQIFLGNTNTVAETSSYDHAGRLTQVKHQVNTGTEATLASMEYNETGQLKQKSLHGAVSSGIQNLNYAYNIRGWLEKVNNPDANPGATSTQKLNLGLYYNTVPAGMPAAVKAQYNGNISAMVWNTPLQAGALSPADKQGYGFIYDGINRLLTSNYGEGTNFATNANANNENVTYDKNGNIKTLTRYKKGIGLIDNLSYTYKNGNASNMLDKVDDVVAGAEGFSELVKQANEYAFDANGNLIKDDNKGYNSILYNYLNLPKRVGTTGQYISYIYDAAGTKLAKVGTGGALTYYAGDFVYSGSSLNYIITGEGMYLPGGSYHYYLKDHLGNTRLVVNTSGTGGTVVQQADYYPFGMDIKTYSSGAENKYRYNGKELQDDAINGKRLDWYDYGARFYDPSLGRFHTLDPQSEDYSFQSPYVYAANNPIRFIDIFGLKPGDPVKDPNIRANRASNLFGIVRTGCSVPHQGFDYRAPVGTPVMAVKNGEVVGVQSKDVGSYGRYVDLAVTGDDGTQVITRSAHLDNVDVKVGDIVEEEYEIGNVGTSGNADTNDPHLHFEVRTKETPGRGLNNRVSPNGVVDTKFYSQDENANQTLTGVTKVTKTNAGYTVVNQNRNMTETIVRQDEKLERMQSIPAYVSQ